MFLLVHQSSELYGSDRSFLSVVKALRKEYPNKKISVILPDLTGPLIPLLENENVNLIEDKQGYIRKIYLKSPFKLIKNLFSSYLWIRSLAKEYDIIYINTVVCVSAILASRKFKNKIVHIREIPTGKQLTFFKNLLKFSKAKLIYNSKASKEAMQLDGTIVYNGVSVANNMQETEHKVNEKAPKRFLLIGRISEWKGHLFLLEALESLDTKIELTILGSLAPGRDEFNANLNAQLKRLEHKHSVEIIGFTNDTEPYFRNTDFVIVPSVLPEPFGRVAVEAMAYHKIPIVANHGGLAEIVTAPEIGVRFIPNDKADLVSKLKACLAMSSLDYERISASTHTHYQQNFSETIYQTNMLELLKGEINV